jgi:hypothetical protein
MNAMLLYKRTQVRLKLLMNLGRTCVN